MFRHAIGTLVSPYRSIAALQTEVRMCSCHVCEEICRLAKELCWAIAEVVDVHANCPETVGARKKMCLSLLSTYERTPITSWITVLRKIAI